MSRRQVRQRDTGAAISSAESEIRHAAAPSLSPEDALGSSPSRSRFCRHRSSDDGAAHSRHKDFNLGSELMVGHKVGSITVGGRIVR